MSTVEALYLALVIAAAFVFMGVLGFVGWQTERYLKERESSTSGLPGRSGADGKSGLV